MSKENRDDGLLRRYAAYQIEIKRLKSKLVSRGPEFRRRKQQERLERLTTVVIPRLLKELEERGIINPGAKVLAR